MRKHSNPAGARAQSFEESFHRLISPGRLKELWKEHGPKPRGQKPKLSGPGLICSLVFHVVCGVGTLGAHVKQLLGLEISNAGLSQRRAAAGLKVFVAVVEAALEPLAQEGRHPGSFYRGMRLAGLDGSQFSVSNTPQLLGRLSKAVSRRFQAAFAKIPISLLVELGTHQPLAVEVGAQQESEWELSHRLIQKIQAGWLVIADRLYGVGVFLNQLLVRGQTVGSHCLLRVKADIKVKVQEVLKDGSALVKVFVADGKAHKKRGAVIVREIKGRVRRPHGKWVRVRLWTDLLDAAAYPAGELLALYGRRWEVELFNRELKVDLRHAQLLHSHTVETVVQEILALVLAMSVLSQQRLAASEAGEEEPLRISFGQTLVLVRSLWLVVAAGEDLLTPLQIKGLVRRTMKIIAEQCLPIRRPRTCPRAVRQPIKGWPRLKNNSYAKGAVEYEVLNHGKV
jgi:Transposase DDE domain